MDEQNIEIRCITYNVRGLKDNKKRRSIFSWLKSKNADLIFLQETHCDTEKDKDTWTKEWGNTCFWNLGTNRSCGTSILISKSFSKQAKVALVKEKIGRYQIINVKHPNFDKTLCLVNVYAPNAGDERKLFFAT